MKNSKLTVISIVVTSVIVLACGTTNNLQLTVSAQNTQIAELSGTSLPAPTDDLVQTDVPATPLSTSSLSTTASDTFSITESLIGFPIKYTVQDEDSAGDGFREVELQLYVQNTSSSMLLVQIEIAGIHARLIDSNQFTHRCLAADIRKIPGGYFPPKFGTIHRLSCSIPNNAGVAAFTVTNNGQEIASLSAPSDGNYNELPSLDDFINENSTAGGVSIIDNFIQIEVLSARFEPDYSTLYSPDSAWLVSLKIKNLYGDTLHFDPLVGTIRQFQVISDSGIYYAEPGSDLPNIPPGDEIIWDFAILAETSQSAALVTIVKRSTRDPAYSNEFLYTIQRLPPSQ